MKCVSSNVWTAVAALVINFPLHLQTRGPASALGFGERDEGHLCFSLMAVIRGLLFSFLKSLYRERRIKLVFSFNLCSPVVCIHKALCLGKLFKEPLA